MVIAEPNKRRVSYVIPPPECEPPLLDLPPFGTVPEARSYPLVKTKESNSSNGSNGDSQRPQFASRNPFATPVEEKPPPERVPRYARHQLGISSLALDTTTVLSGSNAPGGILYTGGKDGLVASWELHVPHTKRRGRRYKPIPGRGTSSRVRWERIGDGGADWDDPEDEDLGSHGDSSSEEDDYGADQNGSGRRRREIPFEDKWEIDRDAHEREQTPPPTTFRESVQTHTDWVNAMVLCNMNQTIITASSDRTIRAWSPHNGDAGEDLAVPALIGYHTDYVRSLAFAKHPSVLFSGSLDRDISIWDIANPKPNEPVLKVRVSEIDDHGGVGFEGEWGSIYSLGVDPMGHMLAAGTPERVVRLWDPRAGDRSVTKLVGHSECVRSILLSDDGRHMLTGSSDTTIKLWSVGEHRCLHTFNHHTSSVWALFSNHPNLERFYSGSRDGHLCVVDVEQCGDMSEGECVVLAKESDDPYRPGDYESKTGDEAIRSIVAMDDEYVWTATSSSDVRRWRDVGRRLCRLDTDFDGASFHENDVFDEASHPLVQPTPLGSAFEPTSIIDKPLNRTTFDEPTASQPLLRMESRDSRSVAFAPSPVPRPDGATPAGNTATPPASPPSSALPPSVRERLQQSGLRNGSVANSITSMSSVQTDESTLLNGIPYESLVCLGLPDSPYSFGFSHAAHSVTSLASGPRGAEDSPEAANNTRNLGPRAAARREFEDRDVASEAKPLRLLPDHVIAGSPGLLRSLILNDRMHILTLDTEGIVALWHLVQGNCIGHFAPADIAEALELERGTPDTRAEIKMHPQEVLELVQRRIEGTNSVLPWCQVDTKVGQITVHLEGERVFAADILAEELGLKDKDIPEDHKTLNIGKLVLANLFRGLIKAEDHEVRSASPTSLASSLPSVSRSPAAPTHISITSPRHRQRALSSASSHGGISPSINIAGLATRAQTPAIRPEGATLLGQSAPATSGWLSLPAAIGTPSSPSAAMSPGSGSASGSAPASRDYFTSKKPEHSPVRDDKTAASPAPQTTPGGSSLLGKKKFMGFGKKKVAETPMSTVVESKREEPPEDKTPAVSERDKQQLAFLDTVRAHTFTPPSKYDAPAIPIPAATSVIISEQSHADGAYIVTYRSQVSSTERDMEPLEMNSPFWLLNYLFTSATPEERRPPKIPLILVPYGQSAAGGKGLKVQASRTARVRGVMEHLQSVLSAQDGTAGRDRSLSDASALSGVPEARKLRPEDVIELHCGAHVADPDMKVGTLKHYYWRGGVDMVLHYRLKV